MIIDLLDYIMFIKISKFYNYNASSSNRLCSTPSQDSLYTILLARDKVYSLPPLAAKATPLIRRS